MAKKKSSKRSSTATAAATTRKKASRRELVDTGREKRYVRRGAEGEFKESDSVGKSLPQDRRQKAKAAVKPGQGDKGDQTPRKGKK